MPIELIDKIKQKNSGTFKLMDAIDIETEKGSSVQEELNVLNAKRIPENISELNNDTGYITKVPDEYITETELETRIKPLATSAATDVKLAKKQDNLSEDQLANIAAVPSKSDTTYVDEQLALKINKTDRGAIISEARSGLQPEGDYATNESLRAGLKTKQNNLSETQLYNIEDVQNKTTMAAVVAKGYQTASDVEGFGYQTLADVNNTIDSKGFDTVVDVNDKLTKKQDNLSAGQLDNIANVPNKANTAYVNEQLNLKIDKTDRSTIISEARSGLQPEGNYATVEQNNTKASTAYVNEELAKKQDVGDYAINSEVIEELAKKQNNLSSSQLANISAVVNKADKSYTDDQLKLKIDKTDRAAIISEAREGLQESGDFVTNSKLTSELAKKQNNLIAGNNINIDADGKTISATYSYTLPQASASLGGIKANEKTANEVEEVKIDKASGKLYSKKVPTTTSELSNTSDYQNSAQVNNAINAKKLMPYSIKGTAGGVAELDASGKVPAAQLPSYVDDVLIFDSKTSFPQTGIDGKIYATKDTNLTYRWSGTSYVEISPSIALGETSSTAYAGDKGKANAAAISVLQSRVNTDEGNISANKNTLSAHAGRIGSLETLGSNLSANISSLQDKDTALDKDITNLKTTDGELKNSISELIKQDTATGEAITALQKVGTANSSTIEVLKTNVSDINANISALDAGKQDSLSSSQLTNIASVPNKADTSYVDEQLSLKLGATSTAVNSNKLENKTKTQIISEARAGLQAAGDYATNSSLSAGLATKQNTLSKTQLDNISAVPNKANTTYVTEQLKLKINTSDRAQIISEARSGLQVSGDYATNTKVNTKADTSYVKSELNKKQNNLTAGAGIEIKGSTIKALGLIGYEEI